MVDFSSFGKKKGILNPLERYGDMKISPEPENSRDAVLSPSERVTAIFQAIEEMQEAGIEPPSLSFASQNFLDGIKARAPRGLSIKQEKWMKDIEADILSAKEEGEKENDDIPKFR
jgi:hypothetical protein